MPVTPAGQCSPPVLHIPCALEERLEVGVGWRLYQPQAEVSTKERAAGT